MYMAGHVTNLSTKLEDPMPIRSRFTTYNVSRWFSHFICWMSAIFLLPICLTYWPRKYTTSVDTHVDNCHQVWRPYAHQFLMSYNVSGWLPLKCVQGLCACAESRDPLVGGQKQLHFWNPRPRLAYSLYNFYWATTTIKHRLLSTVTNAKALGCVNFLCVTLWPRPLTV